jgi:peptidoglycan/LPS O-acetylase OafA/YrhL
MLDYDIGNVNGVVWSLIHEMRISLIFPILIFFVKKTNWKLFLPLGCALCILANTFITRYAQAHLTGNVQMVVQSLGNTFYYIPFFIMGAGFAKHRETVTRRLKDTKPILKIVLFVVSLALITIKWVLYPLQVYGLTHALPRAVTIAEEWIAGGGIVLLFAVVLSSKTAEWLLTRKVFLWLGKVSYSLYLVHLISIMVCARYLGSVLPLPIALGLAPVLALPLAGAAYQLIERPAMNLGRRLTAKSQK